MSDLEHRVAVIIGSSSGIGRATALAFAKAGANVGLVSRKEEELNALAGEIGQKALVCPADVLDSTSVEQMILKVVGTFGRIDTLVYATGTNIKERSLDTLTYKAWDALLRTNLTGALYCTSAVLPVMRRQKEGLIIYVSSACVQSPDLSGVAYQASKHGMVGLAHGTFREERDKGIRTTVLFPGLTDTPLVLNRPVATPADVMAKALQPQDVAEACLYLATTPPHVYIPELAILPTRLA